MAAAHDLAPLRVSQISPLRGSGALPSPPALVQGSASSPRFALEMTLDLEPAEGIDLERLRAVLTAIDVNGRTVSPKLTFRDIRSMPHPAENLPIEDDLDQARGRIERDDGAPFEMLVHRLAAGRYVVSYVAHHAIVDAIGLLSIHDDLWAEYERCSFPATAA